MMKMIAAEYSHFFAEKQQNYSKFIILSRSRTGSTLLRYFMLSHPKIRSYGEVFRETQLTRKAAIQKDPIHYLDKTIFKPYPKYISAVGFKLFYYHLRRVPDYSPLIRVPHEVDVQLEKFWEHLKAMTDLKVIHLKRKNILKTHLSRELAFQTKQWAATSKKDQKPVNITLDYEGCLKAFEMTRQWEEMGDAFFSSHQKINIAYEDLASDPSGTMRTIQDFLGLPYKELTAGLKKQNSRPISETITNYAELKEKFESTPWSVFFEN